MARPTQRPAGLKRQVSPTVSILIIIGVITLALLIGLGGPLWKKLTTRTVPSDAGGEEIQSLSDYRRVVGERLGGVDTKPASGGGMVVLGVAPGSTSGLQNNDIILKINDSAVKHPREAAIITKNIQEGATMTLEIKRDNKIMALQVVRQKSTVAPKSSMPGMGTMRGMRGQPSGR